MGLDFLQNYGGRRLRQYIEQPPLDAPSDDKGKKEGPDLGLEMDPDVWHSRFVAAQAIDPAVLPQRFIDGCHYGETIATLEDAAHHLIPVRLAEIGGVCMRINGRSLRREFVHVERILCFSIDPFPWHEVESFSRELNARMGIRLVAVRWPESENERYDFSHMLQETRLRAQAEMRLLEELALDQDSEGLSLVDGRLGRIENHRAIGVIKQQRGNYLGVHPKCWQVFYNLEPGERTPAFQLDSQGSHLVSWYLKLNGAHGAMPNWGVVRVEISCDHFKRQGGDFGYLDRVSNSLLHLRCRQGSYARAPVSLEPIVRAEDSLKSLLMSPATLAQRFYHLIGL